MMILQNILRSFAGVVKHFFLNLFQIMLLPKRNSAKLYEKLWATASFTVLTKDVIIRIHSMPILKYPYALHPHVYLDNSILITKWYSEKNVCLKVIVSVVFNTLSQMYLQIYPTM